MSARTSTTFFCLLILAVMPHVAAAQPVYWLNHLDFLPGDSTVNVDFEAVSCPGVGGLSGLAITSTTLGETSDGNKVVEKGVPVPPHFLIKGVRVCYEVNETTANETFISQIRLGQLGYDNDVPPHHIALVRLDDGTDHTDNGPICVNSAETTIDPNPDGPVSGYDLEGALRLSLRVNFGDTADTICLRGVGLILADHDECDSAEEVTICHIPPGNPANAHTITVCPEAIHAHLAHGDYLGPCTVASMSVIKVEPISGGS